MQQPAMASKHPGEIKRVVTGGRCWRVVMDNYCALHGDGKVFLIDKDSGYVPVLRAYIESGKASRSKHTQPMLQVCP
jgi:hypothetical protein